MNALDRHLKDYLALRRALGFKLVGEGQLLAEFVTFAEAAGQSTVTTETALEWARLPASGSPATICPGGCERSAASPAICTRSTPAARSRRSSCLPASKHRPIPYLYRDGEVVALMAAARGLRPPLRAATFETLIGLLACTGLRIGEAIHLDRDGLRPDSAAC